VIPLSAVFERNTESGPKTFVYIMKGNSLQEREIEVGKKNMLFAEVKAGLAEGDNILKQYPPEAGLPLGQIEEWELKKEAIAQLDEHFKAIEDLGIQYDYDKNRREVGAPRRGGGEFQSSAVRIPTFEEQRKFLEERGLPETEENLNQARSYLMETQHAGKDTILQRLQQAIPKEEKGLVNRVLQFFKGGSSDTTQIKKQ